MFFFLCVLAMVSYSVQGTLLTHHVRKHDGLSIAIFRNLSLAITMLPLLFLADVENFGRIGDFIPQFLIAGFTGSVGLWLSLWSVKYLPIGIKTVFGRIFNVLITFVIAFFFFAEVPYGMELLFVGVILAGAAALSLHRNDFAHIDNNATKGIFLTLVSALFASFSFYFMSRISRELDPFIAGYTWEVLIGVFALILGLIRSTFGSTKIAKASRKEILTIAFTSWPTLIGTGCFAYAVTIGPLGIASAIGAGGIFVSILLAHFLYHEKLKPVQLLWILLIVAGLVGLKLVG